MKLKAILKKFAEQKKEKPFTTSIRIDGNLYNKVYGFLEVRGINFSDFINEYLKSVGKEIDRGGI